MRHISASLTYDGIKDLNLYCPAVSQSCNLRVSPSTCIVFVTKSIPTVGCNHKKNYIRSGLERILNKSGNNGSFPYILIANEHNLKLADFAHSSRSTTDNDFLFLKL
jgi:hypothetical protein